MRRKKRGTARQADPFSRRAFRRKYKRALAIEDSRARHTSHWSADRTRYYGITFVEAAPFDRRRLNRMLRREARLTR